MIHAGMIIWSRLEKLKVWTDHLEATSENFTATRQEVSELNISVGVLQINKAKSSQLLNGIADRRQVRPRKHLQVQNT